MFAGAKPKKVPEAGRSKLFTGVLGAMFFASGAVALIYEGAWQRQFTLLFGSAAPATAAVLVAYFLGLGLGSLLLGRFAARWRQPILVYGILEVIVGLGALLVEPILSLYAGVYPGIFARYESGGTTFLWVKGALAFAAIAVPTMGMGGTLPVLARMFEDQRERFGEFTATLYGVNTAGAAIGVLLFPLLLGWAGMKAAIGFGVGTNIAIGCAAILLCRRGEFRCVHPKQILAARSGRRLLPWMALAFISGFVTFVLQVGWTRAFAQVHENSVYSFSIVVASFIAAIATGALLARTLLRRKWPAWRAMRAGWIAGGLLTLGTPAIFLRLTDGLKYAASAPGGGPFHASLWIALFVVVFIPITLLGVALPLILHEAATTKTSGPASTVTGTILAANIGGSVAGAWAGGFLFPYGPGLWGTIIVAGTVALAAAMLLGGKTVAWRFVLASGCIALGALLLRQDSPRTRVDTNATEARRREQLISLSEGAHGVVAVVERAGSRRLKLNNNYVLGGTFATGDERMQAHIPLVLHSNPRRIAFLGYGTGITAGGATFHHPEHVTALELVPEVAEAASAFFSDENLNFSNRPGARIVLEDARNFLRGSREQFDVIIGDLVVPWRSGEGALYTLENFRAARDRLAPNGIFCAWLPMFQLGEEDFRMILRTFQVAFPGEVLLWRGDFSPTEPALALIGSLPGNPRLNPETVRMRLAALTPDPLNPQLKHPEVFWMHFAGVAPEEHAGAPVKELNTENLPGVEMRVTRPQPFIGRALQRFENASRNPLTVAHLEALPEEARKGVEAGQLMAEFTLLLSEGKEHEARALEQSLRVVLGSEAARSLFGR